MQISSAQASKTDAGLHAFLERAGGDERVRAIMRLKIGGSDNGSEPQLPDYPSRSAWRGALIDWQQRRLSNGLSTILKVLAGLDLHPRGGRISPTVVVEGRAASLQAALDLPGVLRAEIDRAIVVTSADVQ